MKGIERRGVVRAGSVGCGSTELRTAAGRVQAGFEGYRRLTRLDLPGDVAGWSAVKATPAKGQAWRLSQPVRFGADRMVFGVYSGEGGGLGAAAVFPDGARPYAARLVLRDPARAPAPYLKGWTPGARPPLTVRTPPPAVARAFLAESRTSAAFAPSKAPALLFRFPAAATGALAGLDPREAVTVEFLFAGRGGEQVRRAHVELGDFAAGLAFLKLKS